MKELSYNIRTAKLRRLTYPTVIKDNEIRWSTTVLILTRFRDLKPLLSQIYDNDVKVLLTTKDESIGVDCILKKLENMQYGTKTLQSDSFRMLMLA